MKKNKVIVITEEQKNRLSEELFASGIDSTDTYPEYNNSVVTPNGKIGNDFGSGEPPTGDEISNIVTKQYPYWLGNSMGASGRAYVANRDYVNIHTTCNEDMNDDSDNDGVENFYDHEDSDLDKFGEFNSVPDSVQHSLDRLKSTLKGANLPPKKNAAVLNSILDDINLKGLPKPYTRELIMKLTNRQ